MLSPSPNLITATRWRTVDALMAIAEDAKASARERRLAAMAILEICDQAESALASQSAAAIPAPAPTTAAAPLRTAATATGLSPQQGVPSASAPMAPPARNSPAATSHTPPAPASPVPSHTVPVAGHAAPVPAHHTAELPRAA